MTREEAERAAATFEFPPFRAEAVMVDMFHFDGSPNTFEWLLRVGDGTGKYRCFETTHDWLDYWQRTQHEAADERSASDGATERDATTDADTGA